MERIIGKYDGDRNGPLLICLGAMHGNEPAGVKAIELVLKMLEVEHIRNPTFKYSGNFIGLIGNLEAYKQKKRFIDKDMNRNFHKGYLEDKNIDKFYLDQEDLEIIDLLVYIHAVVESMQPSQLIILDLHTTSSHGGIFTICRDRIEDKKLATSLHAPVVLGMLEGLAGTTLHYFTSENIGFDTIPITFESGQHDEELSIRRAVAGIICCMKAIGSVKTDDVENHHEDMLIKYSQDLPDITKLVMRRGIEPDDEFIMNEGYKNFQKVTKGEIVARDKMGQISIDQDGLILMPLYQEQGEDAYFIVKEAI